MRKCTAFLGSLVALGFPLITGCGSSNAGPSLVPTVVGLYSNASGIGEKEKIIISGTNFSDAKSVSFGPDNIVEINGTDCFIMSPNNIICAAPEVAQVKNVHVTVINSYGTSEISEASKFIYFDYNDLPKITKISPEQITPDGKSTITIQGENIDKVTAVVLNSSLRPQSDALICKKPTKTSIICTAPKIEIQPAGSTSPVAGSGSIELITQIGNREVTASVGYVYFGQ